MQSTSSFRDDALTSIKAFGTGSVAGLVVAWAAGIVTFLVMENDCSGQYMCGLGAAVWAILVGGGLGLLAFVAAASSSLITQCRAGQRLRPGLLTFVGVPMFLSALCAIGGLG